MNSSTVLFSLYCNHSHVNTFEQAEGINVIQILLILMHILQNANMNESMSYTRYVHLFVFLFIYKMMKAYPS
jgi:CRISPR/Cas system-associated endonuclease Cas3-HD